MSSGVKHPFASILVKPSTDITAIDNVSGLVEYYFTKDLNKYIQLNEFLNLPHELLQTVVAQVEKRIAKENKTASDLDNELRGTKK